MLAPRRQTSSHTYTCRCSRCTYNIRNHPTSPARSPSTSLQVPEKIVNGWAKSQRVDPFLVGSFSLHMRQSEIHYLPYMEVVEAWYEVAPLMVPKTLIMWAHALLHPGEQFKVVEMLVIGRLL